MRTKRIGRRVRVLAFVRHILGLDSLVNFDMCLRSYTKVTVEFDREFGSSAYIDRELSAAIANELSRSGLVKKEAGQSYDDFEMGTKTIIGTINIIK